MTLIIRSVASLKGVACPGCHHFGVISFYDTNQTKTKTTDLCLISLEVFSQLEWTKNDLKLLLKPLVYLEGALICQKYNSKISKTLKNGQKLSNQII